MTLALVAGTHANVGRKNDDDDDDDGDDDNNGDSKSMIRVAGCRALF